MSGYFKYNYPAFDAEKLRLESLDFEVESPADMNMEGKEFSWADCMKEALKMMLSCDAISLLDGWENSKGAKIELEIAKKLSMPIYTPGTLVEPAK